MRRLWAGLAALLLLLCLSPALTPPARADAVTDTISVYVGYFGWREDEYLEKATYHWTELDDMIGGALDTQTAVYSYYSGSRTYLAAARGFLVRDLLSYAGIDFGSIGSIDFFTKDHANGAYRSFTKSSLFDLPRYYFPNLAANEETGEIYPYDGDDVWNGATAVEAMLALEDFTEWDVPGAEFERLYDPTMMSANARFHLFFGQAWPEEASTSSAAKYCYKLLVTFLGKPLLSTEETDMELKIGSGRRIELTVDAEDGLLNDYVRSNVLWSSSDESVVSVAADGTLTVHAAGEATITAAFGDSSVSVTVRAAEDEAPGPEEEPVPAASGEGDGAGSGAGPATVSAPSQTEAAPVETPPAAELPPAEEPPVEEEPPMDEPPEEELPEEPEAALELPPPVEEAPPEPLPMTRVRRVDAAALAGLLPGSPELPDQSGGRMEEDSVQLTVPLPERDRLGPLLAGALGLSFLFGVGLGLTRYYRAIRGKKP